jgi:hypothetical protein
MWGLGARELGYRDIVSDDCCKKMTFHSLKTLSNGEKFRDVLPENWHVSWYKLIYIFFFLICIMPHPHGLPRIAKTMVELPSRGLPGHVERLSRFSA